MNEKITVVPLESVGKIKFGMTRNALRQTMGADFTEFRKSQFSANTSDDYGYLHVFYNENDECVAVELFPECEISIGGMTVPYSANAFNKWLLQQDSEAEVSDCEAISVKFSIGMSAMDNQVESVLFGMPGYYK